MTNAFAVRHGEDLLIDTVFENERGAKVNWLILHAEQEVDATDSDAVVDSLFDAYVQELAKEGETIEIVSIGLVVNAIIQQEAAE